MGQSISVEAAVKFAAGITFELSHIRVFRTHAVRGQIISACATFFLVRVRPS